MTIRVGAIVLAAGFSTRFGGMKLTAVLDNGLQVAQQTLQHLIQAEIPTVLVTRAELLAQLRIDTHPLVNIVTFEEAAAGMGATLAFGIRAAEAWDATLVCLADMPFITPGTYRALASAAARDTIVVPTFETREGHPVVFGRDYYAGLQALQGDAGGRANIKQHASAVTRLAVTDSAILADIDTPGDLSRLQHKP